MKAADLMTRDIVTVGPETPLADAIRLMLEHRVSGLPVVDGAGQLVGLLTEGDLLHRAETGTDTVRLGWLQALLARGRMAEQYVHAHGCRDSILAEMGRHRWAPGQNVSVAVAGGVVELTGMIFDERMRGALRVIAEAVPGVKAVRDDLDLVDPNAIGVYGI